MNTFPTPIFGYRKWFIPEGEIDYLRACVFDTPWNKGINIAECHHDLPCSESPGKECHCGFNAWNNWEDNEESHYDGITGFVAGAGRVEVHPQGFRSSEAQILALFMSKKDYLRCGDKFCSYYGVPVFVNKIKFLKYCENLRNGNCVGLPEEFSSKEIVMSSVDLQVPVLEMLLGVLLIFLAALVTILLFAL